MKRILSVIALLLLVSTISFGQFATFRAQKDFSDAFVVDATFTADSGAAEFYSTKWTLDGFNQTLWSTYPITASYDLATATSTPKVIIIFYGVDNFGARSALDSLGIGTGAGDTLVSNTANKCQLALNAGQYKFPSYQLGVRQIATGKALTTSKVELTFVKPKDN